MNGQPVPETDAGSAEISAALQSTHQVQLAKRFIEALPGAPAYEIARVGGSGSVSTTPEQTIPPGQFFVLGDNRDNSMDSRFRTFGLIPLANIVGPARPHLLVEQPGPLPSPRPVSRQFTLF